jgi:sensor histidine kinase YesM
MRPIRTMVLKMRSIRTLSDLSEINGSKWGEVGQITDSFNFMMRTIVQLKNDSQIYELKMLRSQIGPHFLYNTLSCISLMTKQRREKEVQSTIRSLIDLLSFSFDRQGEFVTLNAELKNVENYIDIQKIRLGSIFTCEIKISNQCGSCLIPKLTLQPIVENAIMHGVITKTASEKKVFIRAKRYGQDLVVFIIDNGMGMDKETIRLIMDTADKLNEKERFSGIGIRNVDQRLKLYYGNNYGLKIKSRPGTGTIVRIAIPAREQS